MHWLIFFLSSVKTLRWCIYLAYIVGIFYIYKQDKFHVQLIRIPTYNRETLDESSMNKIFFIISGPGHLGKA